MIQIITKPSYNIFVWAKNIFILPYTLNNGSDIAFVYSYMLVCNNMGIFAKLNLEYKGEAIFYSGGKGLTTYINKS